MEPRNRSLSPFYERKKIIQKENKSYDDDEEKYFDKMKNNYKVTCEEEMAQPKRKRKSLPVNPLSYQCMFGSCENTVFGRNKYCSKEHAHQEKMLNQKKVRKEQAIRKICKIDGCSEYSTKKSSYCVDHLHKSQLQRRIQKRSKPVKFGKSLIIVNSAT